MLVRARRSFAGPSIHMKCGEIRDVKQGEAKRLIRSGHVEKASEQPHDKLPDKKEVAEDEDKPDNTE